MTQRSAADPIDNVIYATERSRDKPVALPFTTRNGDDDEDDHKEQRSIASAL
jgi:hypothetical protein